MRNRITILLSILGNQILAQHQPIPTQFDKFINQPSIEWAAQANDTVRFEKYDLNKILLLRLVKNEIKASLPTYSGISDANHIGYISKDSIDKMLLYPACILPIYDSSGLTIGNKEKMEPYKIDTFAYTLTDITQILYIENGELKSYIPWISPRIIPVSTSMGVLLGNSDYFSSCFNFTYNLKSDKQNKKIFLSQTKRRIRLDTIESGNRLKELYGRNLIAALWPYVLNGKLPIFSIGKNKRLDSDKLDSFILSKDAAHRFLYDTAGIKIGEEYYNEAPLQFYIKEVELIQNWYYDYNENLVFCKIPELVIFSNHWMDGHETKESSPILKIVFN
jgi:hypothetical protein